MVISSIIPVIQGPIIIIIIILIIMQDLYHQQQHFRSWGSGSLDMMRPPDDALFWGTIRIQGFGFYRV